jgi:hypothetical protein
MIAVFSFALSSCAISVDTNKNEEMANESPLFTEAFSSPTPAQSELVQQTPMLLLYQDEEYGFSFLYKEEWEIKEQNIISAKKEEHLVFLSPIEDSLQKQNAWVSVLKRGSLAQIVVEAKRKEGNICDTKEEVSNVNGISAIKVQQSKMKQVCNNRGECTEKCQVDTDLFFFEHNENIYEIGGSSDGNPLENLQNILSTFSFEE